MGGLAQVCRLAGPANSCSTTAPPELVPLHLSFSSSSALPALPLQLQLSLELTQNKLHTSTASSCTDLAPTAGNVAESRSSAPSLHFGGLQMALQFSGCTICTPGLHWSSWLEN